MSTMLNRRLQKDNRMSELNDALEAVRDVIRPHELDTIHDSSLIQAGLITLNFTLGHSGLRWLFTRHTYCFLGLARQIGALGSEIKNRGTSSTAYNLDASVVGTICMWLIRERAKEENRELKSTVGMRLVNEYLKVFRVPSDLQSLVRAEFRHHFHLYIGDEGKYQCGMNYMKIREVRSGRRSSGDNRVIPLTPRGE